MRFIIGIDVGSIRNISGRNNFYFVPYLDSIIFNAFQKIISFYGNLLVDSVKMMILSSISNGLKSILVVLIGLGIRPEYFGF
jgi:hypothetical protein